MNLEETGKLLDDRSEDSDDIGSATFLTGLRNPLNDTAFAIFWNRTHQNVILDEYPVDYKCVDMGVRSVVKI